MKKYIKPKNNVIELKDDICGMNPGSPQDPNSANNTTGDDPEYVKEERGWASGW